MSVSRRAVLNAIAAETASRAGPMPSWLVPVACNATSQGDKLAVDQHLIALRQERYISLSRNASGRSGIELTAGGREELKRLNAEHPERKSAERPAPSAQPEPETEPENLLDKPSSSLDSEQSLHPVDPVNPEKQPGLYALLCACAELVGNSITLAVQADDMDDLARLLALGDRLLQATRRTP